MGVTVSFCPHTKVHNFTTYTAATGIPPTGALKSRDLTTRHHIARVDIARLVSLCE